MRHPLCTRAPSRPTATLAMLAGLVIGGCYAGTGDRDAAAATDGTSDDGGTAGEPGDDESGSDGGEMLGVGPTGLRLLTPTQHTNSLIDILGQVAVEPVGQWRSSIAAAQGGVSPTGVEDYENAAHQVVAEVFADPARRMALTGCVPGNANDDPCVITVIETLGLRAWRRPLTAAELQRYGTLAFDVTAVLGGDPWVGLQYAVAGLLQSPNFLYRVELGAPDPDGGPDRVRLDDYEVASRLSYLVWNTTPDDALLAAAGDGALADAAGLGVEIDRLLQSPRARDGVVQVFVDALDLDALLSLQKDAVLLPAFTPTLGPAMRQELVQIITDTVLDQSDFRRLFDTQQGYVNDELAALYGLTGTFGAEHTPVTLPDARGGLLTSLGFLAIYSGEASTSPTKRGLTVRRALLCQHIPPPPPGVEAELPEPGDGQPQTKREQLEVHATDPTCAACHTLTDPIGLALEHFDAIGGFRATDNGLAIDPSGDLDGAPFADAVELGARMAEHPAVAQCMIQNLYRYAVGHVEQPEEADTIFQLLQAFEDSDYDLRAAVYTLVTSEGFRYASAPTEDGQ